MGWRLGLAIFTAVLGMFQFGYNTGVINAPQGSIEAFLVTTFETRYDLKLRSEDSKTFFSMAVSICLIGGTIGALSGGFLANKFGPKRSIIIVQVFSLSGALCMGICKEANSYELLMIGRFLSGMASGYFTVLVPLYISEVAPVKLRGGLGTVNQLGVTVGILTSMILGLSKVLGSDTLWPLLLALIAFPSLIQVCTLPFVPESPKYLILTKHDVIEGKKALAFFRGGSIEDIEAEANAIMAEAGELDGSGNDRMGINAFFKTTKLYLQLFVVVCMHLSQQLSGMVAIFYYSTDFFKSAGIDASQAQYATIGVGAIMVLMTIITIPLMDRVGRRYLHLTGVGGMISCAIMITFALKFNKDAGPVEGINSLAIFLIIATLGFVVFFALGPGSIPWLITGEVFDHASRPAAIAIAVFVNWMGNFAVGLIFPIMQESIKEYSFVPFACILSVLFILLFFYLPETKGLEVSEIVAIFQVPHAWNKAIGFRKPRQVDGLMDGSAANNYGTTPPVERNAKV